MKPKTIALKKAKTFAKEIVYIRCHAICFKDSAGQVIYTFATKKKADKFYKVLMEPTKQ